MLDDPIQAHKKDRSLFLQFNNLIDESFLNSISLFLSLSLDQLCK